jgi:prepilin-type N-terminal cleavage/methylation domain-containing protein
VQTLVHLRRGETTARVRGGFTLAEVAVTLAIVGLTLVTLLQGLNTAKITSAHTRNQKLASELGRLTIGRVAAGLYREELDVGGYLSGTYAEDGYPEFQWEVLLGPEEFADPDDDGYQSRFNNLVDFAGDDEDEHDEEPFERVQVRVIFPALRDFPNDLVLELWIPWTQVYGSEDDSQ